jgi:hypothetical protein
MTHKTDTCRRCGRTSPPAVPGPEGAAAQGWVAYEDREGNLYGTACPDHVAEVEAQVAREQEAWGKGKPLPAVPDVFPEPWGRSADGPRAPLCHRGLRGHHILQPPANPVIARPKASLG